MQIRIEERLDLRRLTTFAPNKQLPIHRWFPYLQAYSHRLMEKFLKDLHINEDHTVLDPFCGIGTTNLTCKLNGVNSIGLDLSPLACFVSRVKTRDYNQYDNSFLKTKLEILFSPNEPISKPEHSIMDKGFKPDILNELLIIRNNIEAFDDKELREFYLLAFLKSLESLSFIVRDGAHYRYNFNKNIPNIRDEIRKNALLMIQDINPIENSLHFLDNARSNEKICKTDINEADARRMKPIENESIDYIITSPPYCNRDNYIAQFKIELFLGGFVSTFKDYRQITFESFRSHVEAKPPAITIKHKCQAVDEFINNLSQRKLSNRKNPEMIKGYFEDIYLYLQQAHRVLKNNSTMLLVIGNTAWSGLYLESDKIICQIAKEIGFVQPEIWVTRYKLNSAQQIVKYGKIKIRESIISLKKV